MNQQTENLDRVRDKIGSIIAVFFKAHGVGAEFHVEQLRNVVRKHYPLIAPDSPGRIMRDMRQHQEIDYEVTNRRDSRYRITRTTPPGDHP